jgi:hypothetical protein
MQTFLPYPSLELSAKTLDRQRLGKQRIEAMQILQTLAGVSKGWANHPAVKMWKGHECVLAAYAITMCREWKARGYKDTCEDKIVALMEKFPQGKRRPEFIGDEKFHSSHRSNLLRKDPEFYGQFGWNDDPAAPYVWP